MDRERGGGQGFSKSSLDGDLTREVRHEILVKKIKPNPDNPRLIFPRESLDNLKESIRISGILVPLTVYYKGESYVIIDGERRLKAAIELQLLTVPCFVLPPPRDRMEYLLHMFRIHNVREDWKLFPTAKKLEQVIQYLQKEDPNRKLTNKLLAAYTSMTPSRVAQCKALLTLPERFQNQLYKEQKLEEEGVKPTKTSLSEDLFFEIMKPIKALNSKACLEVKKALPKLYSKDQIIGKLVTKFKAGNVPNITDLRLLGRILRTESLSPHTRAEVLSDVLDKPEYRIDTAYDTHARLFYETTALERQFEALSRVLRSLKIDRLSKDKQKKLLSRMSQLEELLAQKIVLLRQASAE